MKQKKSLRPLLISITGDIASGKSTVANFFKNKKYEVYSADEINAGILEQDQTLNFFKKEFGLDVLIENEQGEFVLNKKKVKELIFNDVEKKKNVEDFLHPRILSKFQNIAYDNEAPYVFFEVPLLFESGLEKCFDVNIVVSSGYDLKLKRIMERDNCEQDVAIKIINSQMRQSDKLNYADIVVVNDVDVEYLYAQLMVIIYSLKLFKKKIVSTFS